jgi:hypothetical protein
VNPSPAGACRRELHDDLGLDRKPLQLLAVDWAPSENEGDRLLFLFDCGELGAVGDRLNLGGVELEGWDRVELSDNLDSYVIDRIANEYALPDGSASGCHR